MASTSSCRPWAGSLRRASRLSGRRRSRATRCAWPGSSSSTSHDPYTPVKVGVVGGTFDPIHLGHVAMAEAAADCAGLEQVLLLPAAVPPHKPGAVAPAAD